MARPNQPNLTELDTLHRWGVDAHYRTYQAIYEASAKVFVDKFKSITPGAQPLTGDLIIDLLEQWLPGYDLWHNFLWRKGHMHGDLFDQLTKTMAHYLAWDIYSSII